MPTELQGLNDPTLAFDANGVVDWTTQMPFIDLMKFGRPFLAHSESQWGAMDNDALRAGGYLDADGWPTSIPDDMESVATIWDWSGSPEASASRAGVYVMEYDGAGQIDLSGVEVLSEEPGRITFRNESGGGFGFAISETDPQNTGDYIRDISIVREDNLELHEAGALFNPDWIDLIQDTRELRFMDWMDTNNNPTAEWADRPKLEDATWTNNGVPVEVLVRLANEIGADAWFTPPHLATDEYLRNFGEYVRDNLDPGLKATFELSNEAWNWLFDQTRHFADQAVEMWGEDAPGWGHWVQAYAKRATEMALILDDVYGEEADARLVKAIGVQTGWPGLGEATLTAPTWRELDPDNYVAPMEVFDAIAVTTYFGGGTIQNEDLRAPLRAAIADPDVDAFDYLADRLRDPDYELSIPQIAGWLAEYEQMAAPHGLRLISYEGGQHIHHLAGLGDDARELGDFMAAFVRSPQMADLYQELWEMWDEVGDGPFMQFVDVGQPGAYGSWGLRSHLGDETPRAELLDDLNGAHPAHWESRAGAHFQHGLTLEGDAAANSLEGTNAEDYLLGAGGDDSLTGYADDDGLHGGAGDDTLAGGAGRDTLVGGAGVNQLDGGLGVDTAVFAGARADYAVTAIGDEIEISGQGETSTLSGVEFAQFKDETVDLGVAPDPDPTPDPDPEPQTVRNFIFANSLIAHTSNDEHTVPLWLHRLAQTAGHDYAIDGQFGFASETTALPPAAQIGFEGVPGLWNSGTTAFEDIDFTSILMTPANFIQHLGPDEDAYGGGVSTVDATIEIIDWVSAREPDAKFYIYESWPDMAPLIDNFPPSAQDLANYHAHTLGEFHDWWTQLETAVTQARPDAEIVTIPVGPVLAKLFTQAPLNEVPFEALYEDDAPHGEETLYFLASLITYTSMFGEAPPADFEIPQSVHQIVRDNYTQIVDFIADELDVNAPDPAPEVSELQGGAGDDLLEAEDAPILASGEAGDDTITGGAYDDTIDGGVGADVMFGAAGDDAFSGGAGRDTIDGGAGEDTYMVSNVGSKGVNLNLRLDRLNDEFGNLDVISNIERVIGGDRDDLVVGSNDAEALFGGDGDDTLQGGGGDDTISGQDGADRISGAAGADELRGGAGADRINSGIGDDLAIGDAGADRLAGGGGADTLMGGLGEDTIDSGLGADYAQGGEGDDRLLGGGGDDTLIGGAGDDFLRGQAGEDLYVYTEAAFGADTIKAYNDAQDCFVITQATGAESFEDLTIEQAGEDVLITFGSGSILVQKRFATQFDEEDFSFVDEFNGALS